MVAGGRHDAAGGDDVGLELVDVEAVAHDVGVPESFRRAAQARVSKRTEHLTASLVTPEILRLHLSRVDQVVEGLADSVPAARARRGG